ncbi:MAG: hypothetical protein RJA99_3902 [Pseudomonadota bacterium]|jgi:uncharacterized protein YcsI (UPF0317 family)
MFQSSGEVRKAIRRGFVTDHTAGLAPGHVQGNIVILPRAYAAEFLLYCQRNRKPCPLLAVGEAGDPSLPTLGEDIDIRTDVPRYRVWRDGVLVQECTDVLEHWRDDLVPFVIGCSFSFERALADAGVPLRHVRDGVNVSMYRTSIETSPAGRFRGPLVVSMRPMRTADAIRAIEITSRFGEVHGAPVHFGDPAQLGIADIGRPDFGDPVPILDGEVPVFWACGVTPQLAVANAKPDLCITHAPGAMLVCDLRDVDVSRG